MRAKRWSVTLTLSWALLILGAALALALEPPPPGEIERLRAEGTLEERIAAAESLGNQRVSPALVHGANQRLQQKLAVERGITAQQSALAAPPPGWRGMVTTGHPKTFALLIAFSDCPQTSSRDAVDSQIFGQGNPAEFPYESVRNFYLRSSYEQLDLGGTVFDWYTMDFPRSEVPETGEARDALIMRVLDYYHSQGHDFSQYDSDGDGVIDYFMVFWTGPNGPWASFWWGCASGFDSSSSYRVDGKRPGAYGWMNADPISNHTIIHELGHALGLPDYYPYDGATLPGGVGGFDIMDGGYTDHGAFSKYLLGWIEPTVCNSGTHCSSITQRPSSEHGDAVILMPDAQPGNAFDEYFVIQNRSRTQNDVKLPGDGLLVWHVDAHLTPDGWTFLYNNTDGAHKLLRVMEADGLEEIEKGLGANAGDYYRPNDSFGPASRPSSASYGGTPTYMGIRQIVDATVSAGPGALSFEVFESADLTGPTGAPTAPQPEVGASASSEITFHWTEGNAADPESGIVGYQLQVVPKDGTAPVFDAFVGVALAQTVTCPDGQWCRARVRAQNGAGASSAWSPWGNWVLVNDALSTGGFIVGTVRDAALAGGLALVTVTVYDQRGSGVDAATTDSYGAYATRILPVGTYYLATTNAQGYIDEVYSSLCPARACFATSGTPVNAVSGAIVGPIDFGLTRGGGIAGTVSAAATGAPLKDVPMNIYDASGRNVTQGRTDADGRYVSASGLPSGRYYASAGNSQGYMGEVYGSKPRLSGSDPTSGTPISVTAPNTTSAIDFALDRGGYVSGVVTDAAGVPLAGVSVTFRISGLTSSVSTNASGAYGSVAIPAGVYSVTTSNSQGYVDKTYDTPVVVSADQSTTGVDFTLERGGIIIGTVTDTTGAPLKGVLLDIYGADLELVGGAATDSSGTYKSIALPTGDYRVRVSYSPGYVGKLYGNVDCSGGACDLASGTPVRVAAPNQTNGIDFILEHSGAISGTVTDASGAPLSGVTVTVYAANHNNVASGTTNAAGAYTADTGGTGTYYVVASSGSYVSCLYPGISCPGALCDFGPATPISVTAPGTTSGIDFVLSQPGGRISGRLLAADTGVPLSGMAVVFYQENGARAGNSYVYAVTGNYSSPALPTGTYFVRTANSGDYRDVLYKNIACPQGSCDVTQGTRVGVTASSTTAGIDFALEPRGRISGVVLDAATGAPLANVAVQIVDEAGNGVATASTDGLGRYRVSDLVSGSYYAWTSGSQSHIDAAYGNRPCPGTGCVISLSKQIAVIAPFATKAVDFALQPGGRISGTAADADGAPLGNVEVVFYNATGSPIGSTRTDASGGYVSRCLPSGTYYARAADSGEHVGILYGGEICPAGTCRTTSGVSISVTAPDTATGIDFTLALGGHIGGTVTDSAGTPLPSIFVDFYDISGTYAGYALTNDSGLYASTPLLPGKYLVRTENNTGYVDQVYGGGSCTGSACDLSSGSAVGVTAQGAPAGIDFSLYRGGRISGQVVDAAGAPLAGVLVTIYDVAGVEVGAMHSVTDSLGNYGWEGLATGTYYARTVNSQGYVDELYGGASCPGGACTVTSGKPISVNAPNAATAINFVLNRGSLVSGTVKDPTGTPLSGVQVWIYTAAGASTGFGTTSASGVYTTHDALPTGTYYARTSNWLGYVDRLYDRVLCPGAACSATGGTPISVSAPETKTAVDFTLDRGGRIAGKVTNASGGALPMAWVFFYNESGASVGSATLIGSSNFTSPGLPTGTYFARTVNTAGYVDKLYGDITCPFGACSETSGRPIAVTAPNTTNGVDFVLVEGGRIGGMVTDAAGAPLPNVKVGFYDAGGATAGAAVTNNAGRYFSYGLPAGYYFARTSNSEGYVDALYDKVPCSVGPCSLATGRPVRVTIGSTTSGVDFALSQRFVSVGVATVTEGPAGRTTQATFTASLSAACDRPITVRYATSNGTAIAGVDYLATTGTLTFPPGVTTATIAVPVIGDALPEAAETYFLTLSDPSPSGVLVAQRQGVGTILDDDTVWTWLLWLLHW